MKPRKRTPEELERGRDLTRRLETRVQEGMQQWENRRAPAEGREPREIATGWPPPEELARMLRERIAQG